MLSILLAIGVLVSDLYTKHLVLTRMVEFEEIKIIPGFFSLQFVYNPGAAFGMLKNMQWLFLVVATAAILGMLYVVLRRPEAKALLPAIALGLVMGGAAGNLVDRVRFGKVVDFFLFYWRDYHFPNFNVADIGITVGVGLLIVYLTFFGESETSEGA